MSQVREAERVHRAHFFDLMRWVHKTRYRSTSLEWDLQSSVYDQIFMRHADQRALLGFMFGGFLHRRSSFFTPIGVKALELRVVGALLGYESGLRAVNPTACVEYWRIVSKVESPLGNQARRICDSCAGAPPSPLFARGFPFIANFLQTPVVFYPFLVAEGALRALTLFSLSHTIHAIFGASHYLSADAVQHILMTDSHQFDSRKTFNRCSLKITTRLAEWEVFRWDQVVVPRDDEKGGADGMKPVPPGSKADHPGSEASVKGKKEDAITSSPPKGEDAEANIDAGQSSSSLKGSTDGMDGGPWLPSQEVIHNFTLSLRPTLKISEEAKQLTAVHRSILNERTKYAAFYWYTLHYYIYSSLEPFAE